MDDNYQSFPQNQDVLTQHRLALFKLGYRIIPTRGKQALLKGWNSQDFVDHELTDRPKSSAENRIAKWPVIYPRLLSTGVRIEQGLAAIDIDIDDGPMVGRLLDFIQSTWPDIYDRAPARYGGGQFKLALFTRTLEPFRRLASQKWFGPGEDPASSAGHRVEIFGGSLSHNGNCRHHMGIDGPHSYDDADHVLARYRWEEGFPVLCETPLCDLPLLDVEQARQITEAFDRFAEASGWTAEIRRDAGFEALVVYDITEQTRFDTNRSGTNLSYDELCTAYAIYGRGLRCSTSFLRQGGHDNKRLDHCVIGDDNRHGVVAVFVFGDEQLHFPVEYAPPDATEIAQTLKELIKERDIKQLRNLRGKVAIGDYYAFLPTHQYIYRHTGELWLIGAINTVLDRIAVGREVKKQSKKDIEAKLTPVFKEVTIPASLWLDRNRGVTQMSWVPGMPQIIAGKTTTDGGWQDVAGACIYNKYLPPPDLGETAGSPQRWLELVMRIYPNHVDHIVAFCAHRIQRPAEKINHGLVLTGMPGLGKDTLLEPLKHGVGAWNFKEIAPHDLIKGNNDFVCATVLRVAEARDLGEVNRYAFYERCKTLLASPPDMLRVNVKYVPEYYVPNTVAVIFTTNYGSDGLYLPADDRRHYVCGTEAARSEVTDENCREIWDWYGNGGLACVVKYLKEYDLSGFDAKAAPPKTEAFWRMVDTGVASEVPEFHDALESAGQGRMPDAVTLDSVAVAGSRELQDWLHDRKNRRSTPHRMEACGYVAVRNDNDVSGKWKVCGKRHTVYARRELTPGERYSAAEKLKKETERRAEELKGKIIPFKDK